MNELMIFENSEFGSIRTITISGNPWFVGKDVATALGYSNPRKALSDHVDIQDKTMGSQIVTPSIKDSMGRIQTPIWINESGLYSLIFGSKLESAIQFKRWVTSEVLPTLRKTGKFSMKTPSREEYMKVAEMVLKCPNKRVPLLIEVLKKAGFEFDEVECKVEPDDEVDLVKLLNQYSLSQLVKILDLPKSTLQYYRTGQYKPQADRRKYIIETLKH